VISSVGKRRQPIRVRQVPGARASRCARCGGPSQVFDTRSRKGDGAVKRNRRCVAPECGDRWSTIEVRVDMLRSTQDALAAMDALTSAVHDAVILAKESK
jgi:hypothetical protein